MGKLNKTADLLACLSILFLAGTVVGLLLLGTQYNDGNFNNRLNTMHPTQDFESFQEAAQYAQACGQCIHTATRNETATPNATRPAHALNVGLTTSQFQVVITYLNQHLKIIF